MWEDGPFSVREDDFASWAQSGTSLNPGGGLGELCFECRFFTPTHDVSALSIYTLSMNVSFKLAKIGTGCVRCRARG